MHRARKYPPNWPALSHRLKVAAGWRCELCGVPHLAWGYRDCRGAFHPVDAVPGVRPPFVVLDPHGVPRRVIEIVLTAAHVDCNLDSMMWDKLFVGCQRCHLAHDMQQHLRNAHATRRARMATPDLFADR